MTELSRLPKYSGLWFWSGKDTLCLLFETGAEALTWARHRVEKYGGGAIVFVADRNDVRLLGKFGTLPPKLARELVGNAIAPDQLNS